MQGPRAEPLDWADPEGNLYQLVQSLYAVSSGGVFGPPRERRAVDAGGVPTSPSSRPTSSFGDRPGVGLAGAAGVILLYLIFAYRGFRISMLAADGFSKLLAAGLTAAVAIQAFIIIGGVIGLIPADRITLPFVSYGGSSIVANFVVLALLLIVS